MPKQKQKQKPIAALLYDFDKTLSPRDMQEYGFIPGLGLTREAFWAEANRLQREERMDGILAYMYLMLDKSRAAKQRVTRDSFVEQGKKLEFFPGVEDWFGRMNEYGAQQGVRVEHYVISSGLREFIEGCAIYREFKDVYACEFFYDENNVACWPKIVVNYTAKTQFLFRINKGISDISNNADVNKYTPEDERRVPFRNMVYIGDGPTDIPCMKLVKSNGGYSVAVYPKAQKAAKASVQGLLRDRRVDFCAPADYSEGRELDKLVKAMIRKIAETDQLCALSLKQENEANDSLRPLS